jgi:hypothetical protein
MAMSEPATQQRLPKFKRAPERLARREITERSIDIITLLDRYHFLPASLLRFLVAGDARTTDRQLQALFHNGYINRFAFPKIGTLVEQGRATRDELAYDIVRKNREADYANLHRSSEREGQALYLRHEVMVSRFHTALELACRATKGAVQLAAWHQGPALWQNIYTPKLVYEKDRQRWLEEEGTERLPHRPDAFFTLRLFSEETGEVFQQFFYEADRGTVNTTDMRLKFRAHFHFVAVQKKHREVYRADRIRAVLVESPDPARAELLRQAAQHHAVSGRRPTPLFWFASSDSFHGLVSHNIGKKTIRMATVPRFVQEPLSVFHRVWTNAADSDHFSLLD